MTNFCLVDMSGEPLTNEIEHLQDNIVPFTIQNYVERSVSTRPHITLRKKRKSLFELPTFSDSDDSSPCEFETKPTSTPRPLGLTERQRLIIDQDNEYQASLEADREKKVRKEESERLEEESKRLEEEEKNRMEELRVLRKERAPEEPDL